jgi:hypothetical protein
VVRRSFDRATLRPLREMRGPYHIPTSTCFVYLLNRFARWIGLPDHDGKAWHLTTHQGRRTFAHFAALRDRSALFALAQHFGHRDYATTERGQFQGIRMKADLTTYARMLVEAGLTLGVCDYGYCVYREEYSACRGNATGPNPVNREPSTCTHCKNFVVSVQHRPYWLEQARRCERLLNEPALPTQTLKILRERLQEARAMLRSIDSPAKEGSYGQKIPH